jgi:hypothetical protein
MGTEREFFERGDFTAAELAKRGVDHVCSCESEDGDPRTLRGADLSDDVEGWDE